MTDKVPQTIVPSFSDVVGAMSTTGDVEAYVWSKKSSRSSVSAGATNATKPFRCVLATVAELPDRRVYPEQAEFVVRLTSPRLSKTLYFPPRRLRKVIETPADATSVVSPNTWQFAAMAADSKSTTTIDVSGTTVLHGVAFGEPKNVN